MSNQISSPCFVLDECRLEKNLQLLHNIKLESGAEIILAFKAFAMWHTFPLVKKYINGATASSLNEVRLCNEEMKIKAHTYAVAYDENEFDEVSKNSSHLTFNSLAQFDQFGKMAQDAGVSCGLRVNPEYSDVETDLYNPSSSVSRLGITAEHFKDGLPEGIEGLHFHVLCESDSYALEKVLENVEAKFGELLRLAKWLNMGGGHAITREGYDTEHLISLIKRIQKKYDLQVILEPGSAVAWQTGELHTRVLDIVENTGVKTAIIDASFTCHMPDCLEMPYRPELKIGYSNADKAKHQYRLGGVSCLAGDFLEAYSFDEPLSIGDEIVFLDMIHYTMVKSTYFNGVKHPSIGILKKSGEFKLVREFGYQDYKNRLS